MKVVNRHLAEQHAEMQRQLDALTPKPVTLKQHKEGEAPKELKDGIVVMGGDYYNEDEGLVVAANAIGEGKDWEPVK